MGVAEAICKSGGISSFGERIEGGEVVVGGNARESAIRLLLLKAVEDDGGDVCGDSVGNDVAEAKIAGVGAWIAWCESNVATSEIGRDATTYGDEFTSLADSRDV